MKSAAPEKSSAELDRIEGYLASDPANPHLVVTAIDLCLALGKLDAARGHAEAGLELLPDDPFVQHRRGNVLIAQGQLDEAAQVFESLLRKADDPNIAYNLAFVRYRQGEYAQARQVLQPHFASADLGIPAVTLFVRVLHHLGEFAPAAEVVRGHMSRCGADAQFLAAASLLFLDDDQLEEAQRLSAAALASGARPLEALVVAGSLALGRDDANTASALLTEALAISPSDGRSWSALGMATLLNGDTANAKSQLERAVANLPTHIGTLHALGWCQILRGELPDAEQTFRKALELDRNFGETHGGLAVVSALQGNRTLAEEQVQRALRLDPQGLSARYAEMVLSGVVNDPVRFKKLALRLMSTRSSTAASTLSEALIKRSR
jgi:tetratricopeptide (TPR) repeat protein